MKKIAFAATLAFVVTGAEAGNLDEPQMEPEVIIEETATSSAGGVVIGLLLVALLVATAS